MAVQANFDCPEREKFHYCFTKISNFVYKEDDAVKRDLNILLDQLNSLEYSSLVVREQDGNTLISKLCRIVPLHEDRLVVKFSQIVKSWKRKQMLNLQDSILHNLMDYMVQAIQRCQSWARPDLLRALSSIVYENCHRLQEFHDTLLGKQGILVQLINDEVTDVDTLKGAVLCMECLTMKPQTSGEFLSQQYVDMCFDLFTMLLHKMPNTNLDQVSQSKILVNCLWGIRNILQVTKVMPLERLGIILAAVRTYMFYGLTPEQQSVPESLYPSPMAPKDAPSSNKPPHTPANKKQSNNVDSSSSTGPKKSRRRNKKKPDKGGGEGGSRSQQKGNDLDPTNDPGDPMIPILGGAVGGNSMDGDVFGAGWSKMSSSESDWSDTEGGQGSRVRSNTTKVRQCALSCFFWIVKTTDKKVMFGYWSSFIPDAPHDISTAQTYTLFPVILRDPSPKCRMGALAALSALVDGTKLLLNAAEDSDNMKMSSFTPFSVVLGQTVKEIHRCLLLALVSEEYPITLTQLIKCLGTVIANVPYHRLRPGLLSRVIKQTRNYINHRDPNVRVACLTCLGAMASIQPPLMEICHIIQPTRPHLSSRQPVIMETDPEDTSMQQEGTDGGGLGMDSLSLKEQVDSGFSSAQSGTGPRSNNTLLTGVGGGGSGEQSGGTTPRLSSTGSPGIQTPIFTDQMLQMHAREISWVVKLCIKNILPQPIEGSYGFGEVYVEPLPVRLESLQVLAHLTKGYFAIIRNCVPLLQELVHKCFGDKDPIVKLHTAKLLDEFTQVLLQDLQGTDTSAPTSVGMLDKQQVLDFWMSLLNGPIQEILQNPAHGPVRATTCDCISNIGEEIFNILPLDKRMLCLTVVLGLSADEDRFIRASAVRTLGVYVLYKSLREDVSFVTDCTSAILDAMEDKNMAVRVKAAWSLANLCDALALNRDDRDTDFMTDFSDILLLNIITMATKACQDNDKVKANGVRSLGNILRYVTSRNLEKEAFSSAVNDSVKALLKNVGTGAMKVRWNACYALSNMYKNADLPCGSLHWNTDVLNLLCSVVQECKNFKVRINAAIALSSAKTRGHYGGTELFLNVWKGLVGAFTAAEDIVEFIDFRYRDSLLDQISVAVLHLMSLVKRDDLAYILPLLQADGPRLVTSLDKQYHAKVANPAIETQLSLARSHLDSLAGQPVAKSQSPSLNLLLDICNKLAPETTGAPTAPTESEYFSIPPESGTGEMQLKSGFKQIYD